MFRDLVSLEGDDGTQGMDLNLLPKVLLISELRSVNRDLQRREGGAYASLKHVQETDVRFGQPKDERSTDRPVFRL